ncbi:uncharacterized protein LOC131928971 [Physella acuta]|uniref:uncharacterized protein LOC131928971 n=1 Tax=Physella acuta TaxID=109671 RepID=UPI0027DC4B73|nr:uncharacterized protein LOC131928971 [Physella acuta]
MAPVNIKYIVSFSSQDDHHKANNLITSDGSKKWLSHPKDRSGKLEIIMQLEEACHLAFIDIGTTWCASLELRVGRSDWSQTTEFKPLVASVNLMSPADCLLSRATNCIKMFSKSDFSPEIAAEQWDRLQIICRQPFRKEVQYGVSFVRVQRSLPSSGISDHQETSDVCTVKETKNVASIQKHFFGVNSEKEANSPTSADGLKYRLMKISGSAENGCDQGLSRTAMLVLKATENRPKLEQVASPHIKPGLFSDHVAKKYATPIDQEITVFLPTLKISIHDVDKVTIADLRHKFEKKKRRKLTIEEKRIFSKICQDFICDLFDKATSHQDVQIQKGIVSQSRVTTPASKSGKVNGHSNNLHHIENNTVTSTPKRKIIKPQSKTSPHADKSNQVRTEFHKEVISHSSANPSTPKAEKVNHHSKNHQHTSSPSVLKKNIVTQSKKKYSYPTNSKAQCIDIDTDDLALNFKPIKSDKPTDITDSAVKDSHSESNGCIWLNKSSKLSKTSPPISSAAKRRKLNKTSLNILHDFILDTSSGEEEDTLNRKDVYPDKFTPSKPKLPASANVLESSPKTVLISANTVSSPKNSIYQRKIVGATSETSTQSLVESSPRSTQKQLSLKLTRGRPSNNDSQSNTSRVLSATTGTPKNKKRQLELVNSTKSKASVSKVEQSVTAGPHTKLTPVTSSSLETRYDDGHRSSLQSDLILCDVCHELFPSKTIDSHKAFCLSSFNWTSDEEEITIETRAGEAECPICLQTFPLDVLPAHASECGL